MNSSSASTVSSGPTMNSLADTRRSPRGDRNRSSAPSVTNSHGKLGDGIGKRETTAHGAAVANRPMRDLPHCRREQGHALGDVLGVFEHGVAGKRSDLDRFGPPLDKAQSLDS